MKMPRRTLSSLCLRCQTRISTHNVPTTRSISSTPATSAQDSDISVFEQAFRRPGTRTQPGRAGTGTAVPQATYSKLEDLAQGARAEATTRPSSGVSDTEPYHLNIYSHKHNTHITFSEPGRNPIISYSTGNIGLKGAQRGSYDAAYQLSTYTMRKMVEKQWRLGGKGMTMNKMLTLNEPEVRDRGIEVVLRGYGAGREAFSKALLGNEGKLIKPLVKRVTDATRLKFGGTRSPQVRRLG